MELSRDRFRRSCRRPPMLDHPDIVAKGAVLHIAATLTLYYSSQRS
jgi:hypothetical protein